MIGRVHRSGRSVRKLLYYLYGPGRNGAHDRPHLVAGWRDPQGIEPHRRPDGRRDFRTLTAWLELPLALLGDRAPERGVWHCSIRAAPGDRVLSDAEWRSVAEDVMGSCGLAGHGPDDPGVPWIAVRHADDHVHVVAVLGRWDGRRAYPRNDYYRIAEALRRSEKRLGLRQLQPADRTAARRPSRAEQEKARRNGRNVPPRTVLCREVSLIAAVSGTEREFFARLAARGLTVRLKRSPLRPGIVLGYAVGVPGDVTAAGGQILYGGYQLAPDLSLTRLRARWTASPIVTGPDRTPPRQETLTAVDSGLACSYAAAAVTNAVNDLQAAQRGDVADDITHATGDVLLAASVASGSPELRQAAWVYQRAARPPWARYPAPSPAGQALRAAARMLGQVRLRPGRGDGLLLALVKVLVVLVAAVAEYRAARRQQFQAAAAVQTSARLKVLVPPRRARAVPPGTRRRTLPPSTRPSRRSR